MRYYARSSFPRRRGSWIVRPLLTGVAYPSPIVDLSLFVRHHVVAAGGQYNFFHHIFLVRSSQTCTTIGATIPRQCIIEKCASLQRRTRFRLQTFHCYLTT